jgi:hypothetical protein
MFPQAPGLRLSLTTAVPVTTSDVTGATTIYYTPHTNGIIWLYVSGKWRPFATPEVSLAIGTVTSDLAHDIFAYASSGVVTLEQLAWTNNTTRATAIVRKDGFKVKSGDTSRLLVGTYLPTSTTQTADALATRYLSNTYNRAPRKLRCFEDTDSWNYLTAAWQPVRTGSNGAANSFSYLSSESDILVQAHAMSLVLVSSGAANAGAGIGIDSTTVSSADMMAGNGPVSAFNIAQYHALYKGYPGLGKHTLTWLEIGGANSTQYGDSGNAANYQAGMVAWIDG